MLATALRPEMLTGIEVGDRMVSGSSFTDVVIKEFEIRPAYMITTDSQGRRVEAYDPYLKDLLVVVEGKQSFPEAPSILAARKSEQQGLYQISGLRLQGNDLDVVVGNR